MKCLKNLSGVINEEAGERLWVNAIEQPFFSLQILNKSIQAMTDHLHVFLLCVF